MGKSKYSISSGLIDHPPVSTWKCSASTIVKSNQKMKAPAVAARHARYVLIMRATSQSRALRSYNTARAAERARAGVPAPVHRLARRLVRDAEEKAEREEQGERDPP